MYLMKIKTDDKGIINWDPNTLMIGFEYGDQSWKIRDKSLKTVVQKGNLAQVRFQVTNRCNGACRYCIVGGSKTVNSENDMHIDTAIQIIAEIDDIFSSNGNIVILGGEPLLNPEIVACICESFPGQVVIFTNGTCIPEFLLPVLSQTRAMVYVSHDSIIPSECERIFKDGGTPMHSSSLKGVKELQANRVWVGLSMLLRNGREKQCLEHIKFAFEEMKVKSVNFGLPHYHLGAFPNEDTLSFSHGMRMAFDYAVENSVFMYPIAALLRPIVSGIPKFAHCGAYGGMRDYSIQGEWSNCGRLNRTETPEHLLKFLPRNNEKCRKCIAKNVCGGGCPMDAKRWFSHGIDERQCVIVPEFIVHVLKWLYHKWRTESIASALSCLNEICEP